MNLPYALCPMRFALLYVMFARDSSTVITTHESRPPFPWDFAALSISVVTLAAGRETPNSSASLMALDRSLYMLFVEK